MERLKPGDVLVDVKSVIEPGSVPSGVFAVRVGPHRWTLPLVALCVAGLILSSSREAVFGLLVGVSLLGIGRFRQMVAWATVLLVVGAMTVWVFPSLLDRLNPSGYATDPNLLGRFDLWSEALDFIKMSPWFGYGADAFQAGTVTTDNAYLGWMLTGGIVGLVLWITASIAVTPRRLWPVLVAMFAIAILANPFSGPTYAVFLATCGAVAAENARQRPRVPGAAASGLGLMGCRRTPRSITRAANASGCGDTSALVSVKFGRVCQSRSRATHSPELRGACPTQGPSHSTQQRGPRVTPRASGHLVLNSLRYS